MRIWLIVVIMTLSAISSAQPGGRPKLIVGITIDQMRYEYLNRFWDHYEDGGFKRIVNEGFNCRNLHYNYGPTFTGPGHASIYTGTTPRYHGIIANSWYDRSRDRSFYCSEDRSVKSVGQSTPQGQMSPKNMISTTMTDELKMSTAGRSKVIAVSMKDRGATLPGGHMADAAYWMTNQWITSSYYMDTLPNWVQEFNQSMDQFYPEIWETLQPIETYIESWPDTSSYEYSFHGQENTVFPYNLSELMSENGGMNMIKSTPFGNTITTEFAKKSILNENLGQSNSTDFLSISYSSPDYMGHMFGPQAKEIQDNYLRLDAELSDLLNFLDKEIGEDEYLLFLTSDHGGAWVPSHLADLRMPGGYADGEFIQNAANEYLTHKFNAKELILDYSNDQFFLDLDMIQRTGHEPEHVARALADFIIRFEGIAEAYTRWDFQRTEFNEGTVSLIQRGINHNRSGEVAIIWQNGWIEYGSRGTTHGSPYTYDTHVPALFYGWGVKKGYSDKYLSITDIAPTVCALLQISFPSAVQGNPIRQITE